MYDFTLELMTKSEGKIPFNEIQLIQERKKQLNEHDIIQLLLNRVTNQQIEVEEVEMSELLFTQKEPNVIITENGQSIGYKIVKHTMFNLLENAYQEFNKSGKTNEEITFEHGGDIF